MDCFKSIVGSRVQALGLLVAITLTGLYLVRRRQRRTVRKVKPNVLSSATIEPLDDFQWELTPPKKIRPFKPKYHLTMSIEKSTVSNFLEMDRNYKSRIELRRQVLDENPDIAMGANEFVKPAVDELYVWLFGTYLPIRFPQMFKLDDEKSLSNLVTDERIPLQPPQETLKALRVLGSHVDEDFLFLLPSADGDGYSLQGYVVCCPSGFNTKKKLNLKLRDIHTPVPGYKAKLEKSMDRFFERLEVGTYVRRANWAITTHDRLFTPFGNHLYEGEEVPVEDVDISKTRLRTELQTLHRLPQTRALLFSFKTYLYKLSEIKEEGSGPELAAAIDGLRLGNVPEMHVYKREVVWGARVKEYLLSQDSSL